VQIRTMVQINTGTWTTIQVNPFTSTNQYWLAWLLTGRTGQPSYQILATARGLPTDANVTYDTRGYREFSTPIPGPTFPPTAYSIYFRVSYIDGFYIGKHDFTWLTLTELLAYDWNVSWTYPIDCFAGDVPLKKAGDACYDFYHVFLPSLQALATQHGVSTDNLRVIFGLVN
jgi:hypothetical protein